MVTQMSWDQFPTNAAQTPSKGVPSSPEAQKQPELQSFSWGEFQTPTSYQGAPDPTADESLWGSFARQLTSYQARAGERYLGRFGDIEKTLKTGLSKFPQAGGLLGYAARELIGQENWDRFLGTGKQLLPTSEDVRKITEGVSGTYTRPKSKREAIAQEFAADVGSMSTGQRKSVPNALFNNVGIPAASNAAKEVVKELGFGEEAGNWSKNATMIALSLMNVNGPQYAAQLMNQGRNGFGPNVTANIPRYESKLNAVARNMLQGDPRSSLAQQQIAGIRNDISNGQTSMRDLMTRYDALNAAKRDKGLFGLKYEDRKAAIYNINQVRDALREEINDIGRVNPQALEAWNNGVNAFSVIHKSNVLANTAQRFLHGPYADLLAKPIGTLFGAGGLYGLFKAPLLGSGATAVGQSLYKSGQIGYRVWKDPILSKYYWDAMRDLASNNKNGFISNYLKLEKGYEKEYGTEK